MLILFIQIDIHYNIFCTTVVHGAIMIILYYNIKKSYSFKLPAMFIILLSLYNIAP